MRGLSDMYMSLMTRKTHYKLSNLRRMIAKLILAGISEDLVHFECTYSMLYNIG